MTPDAHEPIRLVIYGDFNCPFSALGGARAAVIESRGLATVDWRAVEHAVATPPEGVAVTPKVREAFAGELAQIRELLVDGEEDRLRIPEKRVNTRLATAGYAATAEHLRPQLREALFAAYWTHGEDLTRPEVIERFGATQRDERTAARWRTEWLALEKPIVPVMVLPDGYVSRGLGALARLRDIARQSDAQPIVGS